MRVRTLLGALAIGVASASPALAAPGAVELPDGVTVAGDIGEVQIVDANDATAPVDRGNGFTVFALRLPEGSTCPGDSANDQWRTQTFMIPADEDPLDLEYGAIGPEPWDSGEHWAFFGTDTVPHVDVLLQRNATAGQPGVIPPLPPFSFSVIAGENIAPQEYRIGIACTYFGVTTQYWDNRIVVETAGDDPDEFTWRLAGAPAEAPTSDDESSLPIVPIIAGCAAVAVLGSLFWRRSGARNTTTEALR